MAAYRTHRHTGCIGGHGIKVRAKQRDGQLCGVEPGEEQAGTGHKKEITVGGCHCLHLLFAELSTVVLAAAASHGRNGKEGQGPAPEKVFKAPKKYHAGKV